MASHRISRINEQLKREITRIIRDEVKDPRIGFITLTGVEATRDLSFARVHVSVLGEEEEKRDTLDGLAAAAGFIRGELGRRLHMRRVPELRFELDRGVDHARRVDRLLKEVLPDEDGEVDAPGEEGEPGEEDGRGG